MLSYRHGFHAGSFADVHKHLVLLLLLEHLLRKPAPFCFIDTHAGAGCYDLNSSFALKQREFESGIARLWPLSRIPDEVVRYLDVVRRCNAGTGTAEPVLRIYPGSPLIAQSLMRTDDAMILVELHNTEAPLLKELFRSDRRIAVHHRDGYEALPGLVPPAQKRGLVLMDPSYELHDEFIRVTESLERAWRRWPTAMYMVWYPLHRRHPVRTFHRALQRSGIRRILVSELGINRGDRANRLAGSGLAIVNPPWRFDSVFAALTTWLESVLSQPGHIPARCHWLTRE